MTTWILSWNTNRITHGRLPIIRYLWWVGLSMVRIAQYRTARHPFVMDDFCRIFACLRRPNPGLWALVEDARRRAYAGDRAAMEVVGYAWATALLGGEVREDLAAYWFREARAS